MKRKALFYLKKKQNKKKYQLSSAVVVISSLRVKIARTQILADIGADCFKALCLFP